MEFGQVSIPGSGGRKTNKDKELAKKINRDEVD
jgi:hypothetical protein